MLHRASLRLAAAITLPRRTLFISTEATPNPSVLKFLPGRQILPPGNPGMDFRSLISTRKAPLARDILLLPGVSGCFLGPDFVSVTMKEDDSLRWAHLKPAVFSAIMDFYAKEGAQAVLPDSAEVQATKQAEAEHAAENDSELVLMIKELLEEKVRPMARDDGGDVLYRAFDEKEGVVKVQLVGSCVGCPSSTVTLKNGVENMLRHYIPEVKRVDAVTAEDESTQQEHHLTFSKS